MCRMIPAGARVRLLTAGQSVEAGWVLRGPDEAGRYLVHFPLGSPRRLPLDRIVVDPLVPFDWGVLDQLDRELPGFLADCGHLSDDQAAAEVVRAQAGLLRRLFVLDTSVIQGVGDAEIEQVSGRMTLACSSYSMWELASHLRDDYRRARANVLKLRHLKLLDDPHLQFLGSAGVLQAREIEDRDTLKRLLQALEHSQTRAEFEAYCEKHHEFGIRDLDLGVKEAFDRHREPGHIDYVRRFVSAAREQQTDLSSDEGLLKLIGAIISALARDALALGAAEDGLLEHLEPAMFLYAAYLTARNAHYAASQALPDPNDFEDSEICKHLHLHFPGTLVTRDKGSLRAVGQAIELLARLKVAHAIGVCSWPPVEDEG